jgi:hypothetical protein
MRDVVKQTNTNAPNFHRESNLAAVRDRFRLAFPELTAFFSWLNGGSRAGAEWRSLLDSYLSKLDPRSTAALIGEVLDLSNMGLTKNRDVETLIGVVLGLDQAFLASEGMTGSEFVSRLRERVLTIVAVT